MLKKKTLDVHILLNSFNERITTMKNLRNIVNISSSNFSLLDD